MAMVMVMMLERTGSAEYECRHFLLQVFLAGRAAASQTLLRDKAPTLASSTMPSQRPRTMPNHARHTHATRMVSVVVHCQIYTKLLKVFVALHVPCSNAHTFQCESLDTHKKKVDGCVACLHWFGSSPHQCRLLATYYRRRNPL